MGKRHSWPLARLVFLGLGALGGCNRQDTECLSSMGRKIVDRVSAASAACRQKFDGIKGPKGGGDNLHDRVTLRLRWEKTLADLPLEVAVSGQEIELKGTVSTVEQRARAVELAESTTGVERVSVSLIVTEEKKAE